MRIVVGLTGASGVVVGQRVLEALAAEKHEVHLVVSRKAAPTIAQELGDAPQLPATKRYEEDDFEAGPASSSFLAVTDAVIVAPASMRTVAALAHGLTDNLIVRAADAALRLRKRVVLAPRETPLGEVALENMLKLARMGAILVPPMVGYYAMPKSVDDVTDFLAGKVLDAAGVPNALYRRWKVD